MKMAATPTNILNAQKQFPHLHRVSCSGFLLSFIKFLVPVSFAAHSCVTFYSPDFSIESLLAVSPLDSLKNNNNGDSRFDCKKELI